MSNAPVDLSRPCTYAECIVLTPEAYNNNLKPFYMSIYYRIRDYRSESGRRIEQQTIYSLQRDLKFVLVHYSEFKDFVFNEFNTENSFLIYLEELRTHFQKAIPAENPVYSELLGVYEKLINRVAFSVNNVILQFGLVEEP